MTSCDCGATYDLLIDQGATYQRTFIWTTAATATAAGRTVDITGYTAGLQIRPFPGSPTLYYDAVAAGDLTLGGTAGTIALVIDATATESFTWPNGVYDLLLTSSQGVATRLLSGNVLVSPGVTP